MKAQQIYKYNILSKLESLSVKKYKQAKELMPLALEISKRTFEAYLYAKIGDKQSITPDKLQVIASYFNCKVDDLLNEDVKSINYEKLLQEAKKAKKDEFGL